MVSEVVLKSKLLRTVRTRVSFDVPVSVHMILKVVFASNPFPTDGADVLTLLHQVGTAFMLIQLPDRGERQWAKWTTLKVHPIDVCAISRSLPER